MPRSPPPWLPDLAVLADLFPEMSRLDHARTAASSLVTRAANAAAGRLVKLLGNHRIAPRLRIEGASALLAARAAGRPVVLVVWHAGLVALSGAALVALGLEAMVLRHQGGVDGDGLVHVTTHRNRAAALHRAVRHARAGGLVLVALDVQHVVRPMTGRTALLGHHVQIPRGPAAIARLGSADIMCLAPRLGPRGIEAHVSAALPRGADDRDTTAIIARWWDAWLRRHPGDLWPESARLVARYPRTST